MKRSWGVLIGILLGIGSIATAGARISEMANLLLKAYQEKQPIPVLSQHYPALDVQTAYQVQKVYIQQRLASDQIVGYKAGLTTEVGQKRFGLHAPLTGVLLASGQQTGSPVIDHAQFRQLMIETEIGFIIDQPITQPLPAVTALPEKIRAVMPVIELPELGFADLQHLKGVDIIASNISAALFITGTPKPVKEMDLNQISVTLSLGGQVVNQGQGSDALGDQWKAALWLVNTVVEQGWKIEPGSILMTGVLGKMLPGKPGTYVADYGKFGTISFEIR